MRTSSSLRLVLAALTAQREALHAHEAGARAGKDPEQLHQMRVAVRRLRAILRASRSLFAAQWVRGLRRELDWLGGALGRARDLDVLRAYLAPELSSLPAADRAAGRRVLRRLDRDRVAARSTLRATLRSPRYARLLARLRASFARPPVSTGDVSLLGVAAGEFKKLRKAVRALPGRPDADELHVVRIKVKRARYAAELVRAIAGKPAERFIDQAKTVQDILGEHQDAVVIEEYLHQIVDRTEGGRDVERYFAKRQRKRRKQTRSAFFDEWPKLERRGRQAWDEVAPS
ncbi:MAG TPA: CHAD domain-containing protein [Methylomirabilota bacterium]|nr:CHAD domain-containing protein [Methylomirabilota bacterium]